MSDNKLNKYELNKRRVIKDSLDDKNIKQDKRPERRLFLVIILLTLIFFVLIIYSGSQVILN